MKQETCERIAQAMDRFGITTTTTIHYEGKTYAMSVQVPIPKFIDRRQGYVDQVGFLVETVENNKSRWMMFERPGHGTDHQPKLFGWCGETNKVSRFSRGLVRIVEVLRNGRVRIEPLPISEYNQALEALGYPELQVQS